jgi:hypothetical protein
MHAGLPASLIILSASNTFARAISRGVVALLVLISEDDMIECWFDARMLVRGMIECWFDARMLVRGMIECWFDARMLVRGIECERGSRSTTVVTKL